MIPGARIPHPAQTQEITNINTTAAAEAEAACSEPSPSLVPVEKRRRPRERRVPSTPFTRALGFAGLGAGLAFGTLQESARRVMYGTPIGSDGKRSALSPFLFDQNAERVTLGMCWMRRAALKMLAALDIVRQGAGIMPRKQLNSVLDAELGQDWSSKLRSFDYEPVVAASIGQVGAAKVHRVVLKDGSNVVMKIQ